MHPPAVPGAGTRLPIRSAALDCSSPWPGDPSRACGIVSPFDPAARPEQANEKVFRGVFDQDLNVWLGLVVPVVGREHFRKVIPGRIKVRSEPQCRLVVLARLWLLPQESPHPTTPE